MHDGPKVGGFHEQDSHRRHGRVDPGHGRRGDSHTGHGGYGRGNDDAGAAIAGGLLGFALGSAVSSHSYGPYYGPAYGPGYYGPAYGACVSRRSVWDPYIGRYVVRSFRYAC